MADQTRANLLSLAMETSGRVGSVALSRGPQVLEAAVFTANLRHAVELLPTIDRLCRNQGVAPGQIGEVYVSAGPGSFTGLRIGVTVARTLVWAIGATAVRVPTLDVIAQNAVELSEPPPDLVVILDAKRGHVYAAAYRLAADSGGSPRWYEAVSAPAEWDVTGLAATLPAGCPALGEGIAYHRSAVEQAGLTSLPEELNRPRAEVVHQLGFALAGAGRPDELNLLVPTYVRRPEAEEVWERRFGVGRPDDSRQSPHDAD